MQKWEYIYAEVHVVGICYEVYAVDDLPLEGKENPLTGIIHTPRLAVFLREVGLDGWEAVGLAQCDSNRSFGILFKRPVHETTR